MKTPIRTKTRCESPRAPRAEQRDSPQATFERQLSVSKKKDAAKWGTARREGDALKDRAAVGRLTYGARNSRVVDSELGRFKSYLDLGTVQTTRTIRGASEHHRSSSPDTWSTKLKNQRNSQRNFGAVGRVEGSVGAVARLIYIFFDYLCSFPVLDVGDRSFKRIAQSVAF